MLAELQNVTLAPAFSNDTRFANYKIVLQVSAKKIICLYFSLTLINTKILSLKRPF